MIGVDAGQAVLPQLELPWWNIDTSEWQVARLTATSINIIGTEVALPEVQDTLPATEELPPQQETIVVQSVLWQRISEILAVLWLLTLIGWWWSRRPDKAPREAQEPPLHKKQARHLKSARKGALAGDAAAVKSALLDWARMEWPENAPRSVGELSSRVSSPLAADLRALCSASYGPGERNWDGDALAKSLRSFSTIDDSEPADAGNELPPLFPGSA